MKQLEIKNPCPKKWENMQGNSSIRLCESCDRNVEDFTDKSVEEIVEILENRKERTCARVFSSQLNPVRKIAAAVLIGGMLVGGSCSPKIPETTEIKVSKEEEKEGYVEMEDESIIPVMINSNDKIPVNFEGVIYNEKGEPIDECIVYINEIGTVSREGGVFSINGEIEKKDYDSITVGIYRRASYKMILIPLKEINMKKGLKVYLMELKYRPGDPIIIGEITTKSPIRNS